MATLSSVTKLAYAPMLCKLFKKYIYVLNISQQLPAKYLFCLRKICLCVYRQKYFFFKKVALNELTVGSMSVGETAIFVRKMYLCSKVFSNIVVFNLTSNSILRWNWQQKFAKNCCITLSILNKCFHMMAGIKLSTKTFIGIQKKRYGKLRWPNKAVPSNLYISIMSQSLPKSQKTSATVDRRR